MTSGISRTEEDIVKILKDFKYNLIQIYKRENRNQSRVIFEDLNGYKFDIELSVLVENSGNCNFIDRSNPFSLDNISVWLEKNNKNFCLVENQKYINKDEKLNLYCFQCKDIFQMCWNDIRNGHGCAICRGIQCGENHSLGILREDLLSQWSPENKVSPFKIPVGYTLKVLWVCDTCLETYDCSPYERGLDRNCPFCAGKRVSKSNNLKTMYPEIAKEWDYKKNYPAKPEDFTWGSGSFAYWICSKYGHKWKTRICERTHRGNGCPQCSSSTGERTIERFLNFNNVDFISEKSFLNCRNIFPLKFDFYLPNENILIEYQGEQHYHSVKIFGGDKKFNERIRNDEIKKKYCEENNIQLLLIPYWDYDKINDILFKTLFS